MTDTPPRSGARRVGGWVANLALVAVTLACLGWLLPSAFGLERYVITGGSMSGTFEKGSVAFERGVPVDRLRVGDVITYLPPAGAGTTDLVTHRITSIEQDRRDRPVFQTQGDANAAVDPWTFRLDSPTQPVVQFTVPYVGHVLIALADRETRMLVVGGPAALVALLALVELLRALVGREPRPTQPAVSSTVPTQRGATEDDRSRPVPTG